MKKHILNHMTEDLTLAILDPSLQSNTISNSVLIRHAIESVLATGTTVECNLP